MEMKAIQPIEVITDILCDVCDQSTKHELDGTHLFEVGQLKANWGYGSKHDGERYQLDLCESCFFYAISVLKREKRDRHMFDEDFDLSQLDDFGLQK